MVTIGFMGFADNDQKRAEPIHFEAAEVLGVPVGLELVGLRALRYTSRGEGIGMIRGDISLTNPGKYDFRPVSEAVFYPGKVDDWLLAGTFRSFKPGHYLTKGLRVWWRQGNRHGTQDFDYRFELEVVPAP